MITVPKSGDAICDPPPDAFKKISNDNINLLAESSLAALREKWREEVIGLAKTFTEELGLPLPSMEQNAPLLISGHQPYFYHPGILYKYRLLTLAANKGFQTLFVTVDTEPCEGFPVRLPTFNGAYTRTGHLMHPSTTDEFYSDATADQNSLEAFREMAVKDLATLPQENFKRGIRFLNEHLGEPLPKKMRDLMILIRRSYSSGWQNSVLELPLSSVCETDGFFKFAFDMLKRAGEIKTFFNETVSAYRREHHIRSKANPFPDLDKAGQAVETLFWCVKGAKRDPLFVKQADGKITLLLEKEIEVTDAEKLAEIVRSEGIRLWPRAVTVSIILRVFLGDLFIHGTGGAKYDLITDKLIEQLYGLKPPAFVTASCSLKTPELNDPAEKIAALKQELRNMRFHPERFIERTAEVDKIEKEKEELVENIKLTGADKKNIGKKISELNEKLNSMLAPVKAGVEKNIEETETEQNRYKILADRELPYFLFPPESIPS